MRGPSLAIAAVACTLMVSAAAEAAESPRSQRATLTLPAGAADATGGRVAEGALVAQGVASPSPCEDEMYRKLKAKDVGRMTPREYETFLRKEDACTSSRPPPAKEVGPCEDALYLGLKSKDLNKMSAREYDTFKQKDALCNEYQRARFSGVVPSATPGPEPVHPAEAREVPTRSGDTRGTASPVPSARDPGFFDLDEWGHPTQPGSAGRRRSTRPADEMPTPVASDPALWEVPAAEGAAPGRFAGAARLGFGGAAVLGGGTGFGLGGRLRGESWPVALTLDLFKIADGTAAGAGSVGVGVRSDVTEVAIGGSYGLSQSRGEVGVEKPVTTTFRFDLEGGVSYATGSSVYYVEDDVDGELYREGGHQSQAGIWIGGASTILIRRIEFGVAARASSASVLKYSLGANGVWLFLGIRLGAED